VQKQIDFTGCFAIFLTGSSDESCGRLAVSNMSFQKEQVMSSKRFNQESGQSLIEYTLLLGLLALAVFAAVSLLGDTLGARLALIDSAVAKVAQANHRRPTSLRLTINTPDDAAGSDDEGDNDNDDDDEDNQDDEDAPDKPGKPSKPTKPGKPGKPEAIVPLAPLVAVTGHTIRLICTGRFRSHIPLHQCTARHP
jgi:Flp pilus assembly pilin Flp